MTGRTKIGLCISLSAFAISVNILPALVTWFSAKLSIAPHWFAALFLLQSGAFTLFALGIGRLHKTRDIPLLKVIIVSLFITALVIMFLGYSNTFLLLSLMIIVIGGSGGLIESIGTTLLSEGPQSSRMLYSSQFFYSIGAFSAPLLIGLLLKFGLYVPQIVMIIGFFALSIGLLVLFLVLPSMRTIASNSEKQEHAKSETQSVSVIQEANLQGGFIWLFFTMMAYVILERALASWLPVFLETTYRVDAATASLILTFFWVGLSLSRLFYIFFPKKTTYIPLLGHGIFLLASLLSFVFFGPFVPAAIIMFIVALVGVACGPIWVLIIENCAENYTNAHLIMYLVAGGSLGGLIGPLLTSLLFSLTDITYIRYFLIIYCILLCVFIFTLHPYRNRKLPE